ncbi:MAG TPA: tetratricopeptide repeat protein [Magnetospirillaceae bacterium]
MTTTFTASDQDRLDAALRLHQDGRLDAAETAYRAFLARRPDHPRAMLLLAMTLSEGPQADEAETLLRRCLNIMAEDQIVPASLAPALEHANAAGPDRELRRLELAMVFFELGKLRQRQGDDRASILLFELATELKPDYAQAFNNIALSLHRLGRRDLALEMVERAITLDPNFAVALRNQGRMLLEQRKPEEACAAFERWIAVEPNSVDGLTNLGIAALAAEDSLRAETALRCAVSLDPTHIDAYVQLANTLDHGHRHDEAAVFRREAARRTGISTKKCSSGRPQAHIMVVGGAGLCNLNLQFLLDHHRFDATVTYLQSPGEIDAVADAADDAFPCCDIIVNAVADADQGAEFLAKTQAFCDRFDLPVINKPDYRIARTTRDGVAELLAGTPGLTVPPMRRMDRSELAVMGLKSEIWQRPLLVRPVGAHGGDDLERIESAEALASYLRRVPSPMFYVSEFHDYQSADGFWRKYRLIFVDREVYPYHLTIGRDWKLHYYRVDMAEQQWMKPEEETFLADWRSAFPGHLGDAVQDVARRLDLDFAGIDCAIGRDGNVLLFEANPTMLVHLTDSRAEYPYKHKYVPRIFDAFGRMLIQRIIARGSPPNTESSSHNRAA